MNLSVLLAFAGGLLTFLSPCILPVIPGYLAVLTGGDKDKSVRRVLFFGLGLMIFFSILGVLIGVIGPSLGVIRDVLVRLIGVGLIIFGIHMIHPLPVAVLGREWRARFSGGTSDLSALGLGAVFGIAWTPCAGVILAAILAQALNSESYPAAVLLLAYALGVMLPFFVAAYLYQAVGKRWHLPSLLLRFYNPVVGVVIIILGIGFTTGAINSWQSQLVNIIPSLEIYLLHNYW